MGHALLTPLVVDGPSAFDRRRAAHLLRRAGFAGTNTEVDRAVEQGLEATVDALFDDHADEEAEFARTFEAVAGRLMNFGGIDAIQQWWIYRMLTTRSPLREKLTLFWHGHFATSEHKVENTELMQHQIDTLRRLACSSVHELVSRMARDPAMLVWLDGEGSTKDHPNENFARELMELFTCGIGHYTEQDVQEAARAFTGWRHEGVEAVLDPAEHDSGRKRFLNRTGRFNGDDVIDLLMQYPPTATFLARKLLRFFATPEPSAEVVAEGAALLVRSQFNIKWFLRELFLSGYFYSDVCLRKRIASPVEYVIGTTRLLGARLPATELAYRLEQMGQALFAPPNVKGWDGEQAWIHSSTWAARLEFARMITEQSADANRLVPNFSPSELVPADVRQPQQVVDRLAEVLMQGDLPAKIRRELAEFLVSTDDGPQPEAFRDDEGLRMQKTREAVAVIISLPEFHAW